MTKIANVEYRENVECKEWFETLGLIYNNQDEIDYIQQALAYTLSGYTKRAFHFLYGGKGANGKSTILNTMRLLLGNGQNGYCIETPIDSLVYKKNDSESGVYHSRLKGARMIIATECNMNDRLHTTFIKSFTGGDSITAREKYARYAVTFEPEGKLFISGNEKLKISDDSQAMWERVRIVEYTKQIPEERRIDCYWNNLFDAEASGILNWLIEGWKKIKKANMNLAQTETMKTSCKEYQHEEDIIQQFIDETIERSGDMSNVIRSSAIHEVFLAYAKKHGDNFFSKISIQAFGRKFAAKGFKELQHNDGDLRGYRGLKLLVNEKGVEVRDDM
jgi:putative DNA primase/helicase